MKKNSLRSETEARFLTITGILVAMLGIPSFLSLMKEPKAVAFNTVKDSRSPASVAAALIPKDNEKPKVKPATVTTLKVNCESGSLDQEVTGGFVRVVGSLCKGADELEVKNESNGFTASVFVTKKKEFTTDFIDLKEGENKLELLSKSNDGKLVTRQITIRKRAPASVDSN